jgi:hypothetical protein
MVAGAGAAVYGSIALLMLLEGVNAAVADRGAGFYVAQAAAAALAALVFTPVALTALRRRPA